MTESAVVLSKEGKFQEGTASKSLIVDIFRPIKKRSKWEDSGASNNLGKFRTLKWGPEGEKTFTPQAFSFIDYSKTPSEIEIIISNYKKENIDLKIYKEELQLEISNQMILIFAHLLQSLSMIKKPDKESIHMILEVKTNIIKKEILLLTN